MDKHRLVSILAIVALGVALVAVLDLMVVRTAPPVQAEAAEAQALHLPFARRNHSLIYDEANDRLILFGGWNGRRYLNDVWALDLAANTWYQVLPSGAPPPPRAWHAAAWDDAGGALQRMLVFGGTGYGGDLDLDDVWALDLTPGGEAWTQLAPDSPLDEDPRRSMALATDGSTELHLVGGLVDGQPSDEIVRFDWSSSNPDGSWTFWYPTGVPLVGSSAVWIHHRADVLVFGGAGEGGNTNQLYAYHAHGTASWAELSPTGGPPPARRFHTAVRHDGGLDPFMYVFGGLGDAGFLGDLWRLDAAGTGDPSWEQVSTTGGPPPARAGHAAAVDTLNERMYVIGGFGSYDWGNEQGWVLDLNTHTWQPLTAGFDFPQLSVCLCVEDAREGVVVNKVADSSLSVVVKLSNYYSDATEDLDVTLTVHGDVLDLTGAEVRDTEAGEGQPATVTDLGGGQYRVADVDLVQRGNHYQRQVVFDFYLPVDVYIGYVPLTVQVNVPGETARLDSTGGVNILERAEALVVINRTLMYGHYDLQEVNDLLARTFETVQGGHLNENPLGVVVYMDRYTGVGAWDNHNVDYGGDEFAANAQAWDVAAVLHAFWVRADSPEYLLIVGDDDLIPFYRTWDASEREGLYLYDCSLFGASDEHPGWCEDSDTNPAIHATDENYFFTDDFYGNMRDSEWQGGELEMVVGRLVGETAADMLNLLHSGTTMERQATGQVGLISIEGFQLGFEPVASVPDAIPNVLNVPARFTSRAFEVHNDHEWPQTIDVMEPYGWGEYEFFEFMAAGADLFGLATWGNYDSLSLQEGGLNAHNVDQFRIGTDHPVFVTTGSHSALPVGPPEGAGAVSVVDFLAREGASAVIGPTATTLGSADTLDFCVNSELFVQVLFDELMSPLSGESTPLGVALRDAKRNFPAGVGGLCGPTAGEDEKTITEFVLYGVPWQTLYYPEFVPWIPPATGGIGGATSGPLGANVPQLLRRTVERTTSSDYSQEFSVDFEPHIATSSDGWDILTVDGTRLDTSHGYPLLPSAEVFTACLPLSTTITGLETIADVQTAEGTYNVPNVLYLPPEQGGLTYTSTTTLDELYPSPVVTGERRGRLLVARAMPLQHNPATGETVFHSHIEARLTYTSPTPIAACAFRTNSRRYLPGQTLGAVALLTNVGDTAVEMTPTLALRDALTRTWALNVGSSFELAAGEAKLVPIAVNVPRQEGAYRAVFSAWAADGRKAIAQQRFSVLGGFLVGLERSGVQLAGRSGQFHVEYANPRPGATFAMVHLVVLDAAGSPVAEFSPKVIAVQAASTATATYDWTPEDLPPGHYTVSAWVTAQGEVYGPMSRGFEVEAVYLPLVLRGQP